MSEIVSGVNVITEYDKPQDNKVYGGYINYLNKEQAKQAEYQDYNDYIAKTKSIFTSDKDDLSSNEISTLKEVFKMAQNNGSFMWKTVISFDNRWLDKYGVYDMKSKTLNEPKIREVVRHGINKMLENEGLGNAVWSAGIHYDTDNIHVHVATVEPIPMREKRMYKQYNIGRDDKNRLTYKDPILDQNGNQVTLEEFVGKFKQKSIKLCKSTVANGIMEQKDINFRINQIIRDQIVKNKKNTSLRIDSKLQDMFFALYDNMPDCNINMWKYDQNIMKPYRKQIDKLTDRFLEIYHKDDMIKLDKLLKIQSANYAMAYGTTDQDYRKNKRKDLYYRMGNAILLEMREYNKELKNGIISQKDIPDTGVDKITEEINVVEELADLKAAEAVISNEYASATNETLPEQNISETQDLTMLHNEVEDEEETSEDNKNEQLYYSKWTDEYVNARSTFYGTSESDPNHTAGFSLYIDECYKGNVLAAYDIGRIYEYGIGREADEEQAAKYYVRAYEGWKTLLKKAEETIIKTDKIDVDISNYNYKLAKCYDMGTGTDQNYELAYQHYVSAENLGNIYAAYSLGDMYYFGKGQEVNKSIAFQHYLKGVSTINQINPYCDYRVANMLYRGEACQKNIEEAEIYYAQALKGFISYENKIKDDKLEYRIGCMYKDGLGCNKDYEKAFKYFSMSATNNNSYAEYALGKMYLLGEGIEQNPEQAMGWLQKSAEQDNEWAKYALGKIYLLGEGIEQNPKLAIQWLEKSAEQDNQWAEYMLGKIYLDGEVVEQNPELAIQWLEKSAEQDNQWAEYALGKIYLDGEVVEQNPKLAIQWLEKSAEQDNQWAEYMLGKIYLDGEVVEKNPKLAIKWLEKAADQNNQWAQYSLGRIYMDGKDVVQDMNKAIGYFTKSAQQENSYAQYYLGKICLKGGYYNLAGMWLGKAIQNHNAAAVNLYANQMQKLASNKVPNGMYLAKQDLNKSFNDFLKSMNNNYESWKNIIEYERMEQERLQQHIYQDKSIKDIDLE